MSSLNEINNWNQLIDFTSDLKFSAAEGNLQGHVFKKPGDSTAITLEQIIVKIGELQKNLHGGSAVTRTLLLDLCNRIDNGQDKQNLKNLINKNFPENSQATFIKVTSELIFSEDVGSKTALKLLATTMEEWKNGDKTPDITICDPLITMLTTKKGQGHIFRDWKPFIDIFNPLVELLFNQAKNGNKIALDYFFILTDYFDSKIPEEFIDPLKDELSEKFVQKATELLKKLTVKSQGKLVPAEYEKAVLAFHTFVSQVGENAKMTGEIYKKNSERLNIIKKEFRKQSDNTYESEINSIYMCIRSAIELIGLPDFTQKFNEAYHEYIRLKAIKEYMKDNENRIFDYVEQFLQNAP